MSDFSKMEEFNAKYQQKKQEEVLSFLPEQVREQAKLAIEAQSEEHFHEAIDICNQIRKEITGSSEVYIQIMIARMYPSLLFQDVETENQRYLTDSKAYFEFLDSIDMNEIMQSYLVETMTKLCDALIYQWYRPQYAQFLDTIKQKNYLTDSFFSKTIESAYASMESYCYFDDNRISLLLKNVIKSFYDREFTISEDTLEIDSETILIDGFISEWYLTKYLPDHQDEISYLKDTYPHSYALLKDVLTAIDSDVTQAQNEILTQLMTHVNEGVSKEQLQNTIDQNYQTILEQPDTTNTIYNGKETYHRNGDKIGRNDPCPCGSGKKYKHCCQKH